MLTDARVDVDVVIATVGFTSIINTSFAFKWLRDWLKFSRVLSKFIKCPQCVSGYIGAFLCVISGCPWLDIILTVGACSVASYTWYLLIRKYIEKYD